MAKKGKWKEYLAELLVVIVGITIAFSIENYAANQKEKAEELLHLKGIADDLKNDLRIFQEYLGYNENTLKFAKRFNYLLQSGDRTNDSLNFLLMRMGWISSHDPRDISYQSLRSSGGLDKISNFELRNQIVYHYQQKTSQVRFLNEMHNNSFNESISPTILKYADFTNRGTIESSFYALRENINLFAGFEGLLTNKINEYQEAVTYTQEMLDRVEEEIKKF